MRVQNECEIIVSSLSLEKENINLSQKGDPYAQYFLAVLNEKEGNIDAARSWYVRAHNNGVNCFINISRLLFKKPGELNRAVNFLRTCIKISKDSIKDSLYKELKFVKDKIHLAIDKVKLSKSKNLKTNSKFSNCINENKSSNVVKVMLDKTPTNVVKMRQRL